MIKIRLRISYSSRRVGKIKLIKKYYNKQDKIQNSHIWNYVNTVYYGHIEYKRFF